MDDLVSRLSNVNVTDNRVPLIVDPLNYLSDFFLPSMEEGYDPFAAVKTMRRRSKEFVASARLAGYNPIFVVDCGWKSEENEQKWTERREKELKEKPRNIPLNADDLLSISLIETGCDVFCISDTDADDVVAKLAEKLGPKSLILSGDGDMFRYNLPNACNRIKASFALIGAPTRLTLFPSPNPKVKEGVAYRNLNDIQIESWDSGRINKIRLSLKSKLFRRGCCSPLTRKFGNLHGIISELRHALFHRKECLDVKEKWPEWSVETDSVSWRTNDSIIIENGGVNDAMLTQFINDPRLALTWLEERDPSYGSAEDSPLRKFARCIIVTELMEALTGNHEDDRRGVLFMNLLALISGRDVAEDVDPRAWPPEGFGASNIITCKDCREEFFVGTSERRFFAEKGFHLPVRCGQCREKMKKNRGNRY